MSKIILPVIVLASIALIVCDDASAGWRRARRRGCCGPTYPAVVAPAPAATYTPAPVPVAPSTSPPVAAAPTYRSYSYEPGTVSGGTYVPAQPYVQPIEPSQSNFFRADRKMHGLSWYRGK